MKKNIEFRDIISRPYLKIYYYKVGPSCGFSHFNSLIRVTAAQLSTVTTTIIKKNILHAELKTYHRKLWNL